MGTSGSDSHVSEEGCLLRGMKKSCVSCPSKQTRVTDGRAIAVSQQHSNSKATLEAAGGVPEQAMSSAQEGLCQRISLWKHDR